MCIIFFSHEDGSVKLWDASGFDLQLIHKLKTNKIIDKKKIEGYDMDQPFKITCIHMNNTYLAVAGAGGHVTLYKYYSKVNNTGDELADLPV